MKHLYLIFIIQFFSFPLLAQETLTFSGYNGSGSTLVVTASSNVNQTITIVFEDSDIIQNFYTQFQNSIFLYGGLDTDAGGFQDAPDFNNLANQPELILTDADNNAQPNTYSITINLAQHYAGVANGTMVYGFNLLFQNQFGGGGNNQTLDLYIDLADSIKDDTLNLETFRSDHAIFYANSKLIVNNYQGKLSILVFDILGKVITSKTIINHTSDQKIDLDLKKDQLYFISVYSNSFHETLKVISK